MKNYLTIFFAFMLVAFISCHHKEETVDLASAQKAVTETMEKLNAATKARDVNAVGALISEDALLCGTDKSEFWDKPQGMKTMSETLANENVSMNFTIEKQVIRMADDGKSAVVIEQYIMPDMFGPNLPIRSISHLVKTENEWLIDFFSWNVIPNNEDLAKIAAALAD